jgi:predicted anti-sigma-YlaC factor YlaD
VTCEDVRVALSARLDGEDPGSPPEEVDAHLAGCAGCTGWLAGARRLPRTIGDPPPGLTDRIMAAVAADPVIAGERARGAAQAEAAGRRQVLRVAVAAAAAVQLALALPTLVGALLGTVIGPHASREMASFDIAVAVGFLVVAYRPAWAGGFVPVAFVLAACLAVTSGVDVARGVAGVGHEIGHLVAVVQAGLVWALSRAVNDAGPGGIPRARVAGSSR